MAGYNVKSILAPPPIAGTIFIPILANYTDFRPSGQGCACLLLD